MKDTLFYKIMRPFLYLCIKLYRPTIIGKENIPNNSFILAGNHMWHLDPLLVALNTKKQVHFFAKNELYKGMKKYLFKGMGIIPVNRSIHDKNALNMGIKALNKNLVVGIFPEGKLNKTNDIILPFKYGTVKMSYVTNKFIVPFAIKGKYKFLKKCVTIIYGTPFKASGDLVFENKKLENTIIKLLRSKI